MQLETHSVVPIRYHTATIRTTLPPETVMEVLAMDIDTSRSRIARMFLPGWGRGGLPFEGTITNNRFRILYLVGTRRRNRPIIRGEVLPSADGSVVTIRIGSMAGGIIGSILMLGFLTILLSQLPDFMSTAGSNPLMVVWILVWSGSFVYEVFRQKRIFTQALEMIGGHIQRSEENAG
jgi:hypothetical protein